MHNIDSLKNCIYIIDIVFMRRFRLKSRHIGESFDPIATTHGGELTIGFASIKEGFLLGTGLFPG